MTRDERRKMLIFRSWHRGTREMDLLLGSFAEKHVPGFDDTMLDQFEHMLTCNDPDLYNWLTGLETPPADEQSPVLDLFLAHRFAA